MDNQQWVLTAIGPDRPGLVREISSVIHQEGGNLENSRMAILAGDFALLVLFSATTDTFNNIQQRTQAIEQEFDFTIRYKRATPQIPISGYKLYDLELTGVDQPGILHTVSEVFANQSINVASLETHLRQAAFHGTPMFSVRAQIQLKGKDSLETLQGALDRVCCELGLTYDLTNPVEN